jgi:DNA-binding MarR family transcriptional regulator
VGTIQTAQVETSSRVKPEQRDCINACAITIGIEALSQTDLQRRLGVDPAAITRQVRQLEAEGLVTRRTDPVDRRVTRVALTAAGRQLIEDLLRKRAEFDARAAAGLDVDQRAALVRGLRHVRANVAPAAQPPG